MYTGRSDLRKYVFRLSYQQTFIPPPSASNQVCRAHSLCRHISDADFGYLAVKSKAKMTRVPTSSETAAEAVGSKLYAFVYVTG